MGMTLKTTAAAGALLITFLTAAAPALQGQQRPRITESVDSRRTVLLPGTTHARIRQAQDRGRVAADLVMDRAILTLNSSPEQEAELGALLAAQQESSSPHYHQWLTPKEFGERFGVSAEDMSVIIRWFLMAGAKSNSAEQRGRSNKPS